MALYYVIYNCDCLLFFNTVLDQFGEEVKMKQLNKRSLEHIEINIRQMLYNLEEAKKEVKFQNFDWAKEIRRSMKEIELEID